MKKNVAIITARGGSKRIPRKNIKFFLGKPIMAYSIEAALQSGIFDEIMVSTEDEEIAQIAKQYGASIPFMRSARTANDMATTMDVLIEVLEQYKNIGQQFEYMCCIYPTAPFVTADKLKEAYRLLTENGLDSTYPVVPFSYPPQRGIIITDNNEMQYWQPQYEATRSQDLKTIYHDCGQFYFAKVDAMLYQRSLIMKKTIPMIVNEMEQQDIDNETDWKLAEMKYRLLYL